MNKKSLAPFATCSCLAILTLIFFLALVTDKSISPVAAQILPQENPTVISIEPATAPNDLDTIINISGTGFSATITNTQVISQPTVMLGNIQLNDATWITTTQITATVPWGMNTGSYDLTVTNPDGGSDRLTNAYNVTQGIGRWNGGDLFGGEVRQILMKPGDPNTIYASASGVGLFRSRDASENWKFVNASLGNPDFTIDPLHPSWLYCAADGGLFRSQDEGDTWTKLIDRWPDGRNMVVGRAYPSPHDPQVLFFSSSANPGEPPTGALGLIISNDGGVSWSIVDDLEGIAVQDVSFHPTDPLQMVVGTQVGQVFQSTDGGEDWTEMPATPLTNIARISHNPYQPSEVWISFAEGTGLYKTTDPNFLIWQDVTPEDFRNNLATVMFITFTSEDSIYIFQHHSVDGGLSWQRFGPLTSYGEIKFNPDNSLIGYIGDNSYGVYKTMDGGQTWEIKNQGLTGMTAFQVDTSRINPLRIYALFGDSPGVYRSDDGANSWTFLPLDSFDHVNAVREDPFNSQMVYLAGGSGFYTSTNAGLSWLNIGWNISQPWEGGPGYLEPDPYQSGHLLVGFNIGSDAFHLHDRGQLYSSSDFGTNWQPITVTQSMDLGTINRIIFHPEIEGLVYIATGGTGVYQSTNGGGSWTRIDDLQQPDMQMATDITIATHPQPMLLVGTGPQYPFRSLDGGVTWEHTTGLNGGARAYLFLDGNSTRLYAATFAGLYFSSDAGDTWEPAAGILGELHISALDYAVDVKNGYSILYAATCGGIPGNIEVPGRSTLPDTQYNEGLRDKPSVIRNYAARSFFLPLLHRQSEAPTNLVDAGIYRFVNH